MDSAKILKSDFLDILFEDRNKNYGAYELRKKYDKRVRNSILATAGLALLIVGGYLVYLNAKGDNSDMVKKPIVEDIKLEDVKLPDDPKTPPPPPPGRTARGLLG